MKNSVQITEVGPRDGLQNEKTLLSLEQKKNLILFLIQSGLKQIEVGSFVKPELVPQMKDTDAIAIWIQEEFSKRKDLDFLFLVPNEKGLERALEVKIQFGASFTAASESFTLKNTGMNLQKSLETSEKLIKKMRQEGLKTRAYVSTAFGCPFEGKVKKEKVLAIIDQLFEAGANEVSIGDTIGVAFPKQVEDMAQSLYKKYESQKIIWHFHDTYGMALANASKVWDLGGNRFDTSVSGLGGCPFAPGATGNLATEDLLYFCDQSNIETGLSLEDFVTKSQEMILQLKLKNSSRVASAFQNKKK